MAQNDQNAKILLAEDDNDMRRFLVKALQNAGFDVISYDNGLSAYQRLREEPFQLLLTDIVMPEMDGIELARRAAELDPDIKIMFITGFAAVALNADSAAPKHAKVLSKPIHLRNVGRDRVVAPHLLQNAVRSTLHRQVELGGQLANPTLVSRPIALNQLIAKVEWVTRSESNALQRRATGI